MVDKLKLVEKTKVYRTVDNFSEKQNKFQEIRHILLLQNVTRLVISNIYFDEKIRLIVENSIVSSHLYADSFLYFMKNGVPNRQGQKSIYGRVQSTCLQLYSSSIRL